MVEAQKTGIHAVEHRVRMRCATGTIGREWGVSLHERTVGKLLRLAFRRLSVRPQHPKSDPEAQARFSASSPVL